MEAREYCTSPRETPEQMLDQRGMASVSSSPANRASSRNGAQRGSTTRWMTAGPRSPHARSSTAKAAGGGIVRFHLERVAATVEGVVELSERVTHPCRVRVHGDAYRIEPQRTIGLASGFVGAAHRRKKIAVHAMRGFAARRQRDRPV